MLKKCFLLAFSLLGALQIASACSCAPFENPLDEMKFSRAVFVGTVTDISLHGKYENRATFQVEKTWKGPNISPLVVSTSSSGGSCGNDFQVGESWLVYASGEHNFSSSLCSLTKPLDSAESDLAILGQGRIPLSKTAQFVRVILPALLFSIALWGVKKFKR